MACSNVDTHIIRCIDLCWPTIPGSVTPPGPNFPVRLGRRMEIKKSTGIFNNESLRDTILTKWKTQERENNLFSCQIYLTLNIAETTARSLRIVDFFRPII